MDELHIKNNEHPKSDHEACEKVLRFINWADICGEVTDSFRLGAKGEQIRPIEISLGNKASVSKILVNASKLKDLQNHTIYIKGDKSVSERKEFQRLGKKKVELLKRYPVDDPNAEPHVTLKKGILMVDGVKVDE